MKVILLGIMLLSGLAACKKEVKINIDYPNAKKETIDTIIRPEIK